MITALDSSAMIAFLRNEEGANDVEKTLAQSLCFAHSLNLCEVFYDIHRRADEEAAQEVLR